MDPRALLDAGLEISFVGSFTRIGPAVRRRLFGWSPPPAGAMAGRTVLVTGPTSGLGRAATDELAALGARVILVGRSAERLALLRDELVGVHGEDRFPVVVADMGSLASVRAAVARILETESRLDVLIDNAGAIYPERIEGPDGIEATLAVLVVGPFALVAGLLPLLRRTPDARVIAVTSGGMYFQRLDLDDLQSRVGEFTGARAYARSKRAQIALVREWSRRFAGSGVSFAVMHPGWADTPGLAETLPALLRADAPAAPHARGRSRHDHLARHPSRARHDERPALPGSPAAAVRSNPFDPADRSRPSAPVGRDRGVERGGGPGGGGLSAGLGTGGRPAPAADPGGDAGRPRRPGVRGCPSAPGGRPAQPRRPTALAMVAAASTTFRGSTRSPFVGASSSPAAAPPTATIGTACACSAAITAAAPSRSAGTTTPTTAARARVRAATSIQPSTVTSGPR